jgi:hypothetical protein
VTALGAAVWLVALLVLLLSRRRRFLADVLLAIAMVSVAAWALRPPAARLIFGLGRATPPGWSTLVAAADTLPAWLRSFFWEPRLIHRLLLLAASVALVRWVRVRTLIPFPHCGGCGYNLTENVSGVCPECGLSTAKGRREAMSAGSPMIRRLLFHLLSAASVVILGITLILWARTMNRWDWFEWGGAGYALEGYSAGGFAECSFSTGGSSPVLKSGSTHIAGIEARPAHWPASWGFTFESKTKPGHLSVRLGLPHWFIALVSSILPIRWLRRLLAKRRLSRA